MNSTSSSSSLPISVASVTSKSNQPLPAKHPSRTSNPQRSNGSTTTTTAIATTTTANGGGSDGSVGSAWDVQWSSLQGLANSVLGSGVAATSGSPANQPHESPAAAVRRRRRPTDGTTATGSGGGGGGGGRRSHSSGSWLGEIPILEADSSNGASGSGSGDARSRSTRRFDLEEPSSRNSTRSRRMTYKRSTSPNPMDDPVPLSAPEAEWDALAYVHRVKPTDTLEGVVIMYNIHASALRRANGMWPNDSVQRRKILLLPVEDCGVKGKPIGLLNLDLTCNQQVSLPPPQNEPTPEEKAAAEERGYRHESYVMIDGIGQVEIARLARKKLSHFPPRRRKERVSLDATTGFGTPPLDDEGSVFRGMTPGVGALGGSGGAAGVGLHAEEPITKALMGFAQGTSAGLENVGGVIEGFVRKWTAKAQVFATHDLIELTQRLGLEIEEEGGSGSGGRNGGENARSSDGSGGRAAGDRRAGSSTARGDGRVVRERLPRPRRERGDGARNGNKLL